MDKENSASLVSAVWSSIARDKFASFCTKIDKSAGDTSCWIWTGRTNKDGYGYTSAINGNVLAHRVMYDHEVEPIPKGMCVLHHCDNPACVNPAHLFMGTRADNNRDRNEKGRTVGSKCYGLNNGKATLTDEQVAEIRRLYTPGKNVSQLARQFGIPHSTLINIATGRRRKVINS